MPLNTSEKTVGRLSLYRRLLQELSTASVSYVYSHQLATKAGVTAAKLRRDIMAIGYTGSPSKGYDVVKLAESIAHFLEDPEGQPAVIIGVGNLGRAIMSYFGGRRPKLQLVAAFDSDEKKVNRVIHNIRCFSADSLEEYIVQNSIKVAVITVPVTQAQNVADILVRSGVKGIMNFAPIHLRVPSDVFIEDIDLAISLEKVAYFARQNKQKKEA
ncbi:MAG: redox-sensing transcriptional repressor Rex [Phycisphaerae bacterium]|nr:redox-sensing transcriptional repressor Rex [Phycisphaerae bacterium]